MLHLRDVYDLVSFCFALFKSVGEGRCPKLDGGGGRGEGRGGGRGQGIMSIEKMKRSF